MKALTLTVLMPVAILATQQATAADDPWLDLAVEQAEGDEQPLIAGIIDYVSLRLAMEVKPDIIRAQLVECGNCTDRAALERSLEIAERDRQVISTVEAAVARWYGADPWDAWKIGIKIRPDHVLEQPPPCIALYDRAYDCAVANDDRYAGRLGRACHVETRLHELCAAGQAKSFYEYVEFLRKKERGDLLFETDNSNFLYYYNVQPDMAFPRQPVDSGRDFYAEYSDNRLPGTLNSVWVTRMAVTGPGIDFSNAENFRLPWRTIIQEDNTALSGTAHLLKCAYNQSGTNNLREFVFWYRALPTGAETAYLSARMENHPLLRIGRPLETCPINADNALAVLPFLPTQTLQDQYGEMLSQTSDAVEPRAANPAEIQAGQDAAAERARIRANSIQRR